MRSSELNVYSVVNDSAMYIIKAAKVRLEVAAVLLATLVVLRVCRQACSLEFTGSNPVTAPLYFTAGTRNAISQLSIMDRFCIKWDHDNFDIDEWWTHHPEYVIELQNTTHQCFQREVSPEKSYFFREVYRHQFKTGCDPVFARYLRSSGWGSDFAMLAQGLYFAMEEKKPMMIVPNPQISKKQVWQYAALSDGSKATCPSKNLDCYFLPVSSCKPDPELVQQQAYQVNDTFNAALHSKNTFPWAYQYLTRGQQWIRRAVVNFVEQQKPPFPQNETCTVIHVRRGDVVLQKQMVNPRQNRGYHPIADYLDLLPEERRRPGSNILLFTDDADAIDEAQLIHPEINWHWFNRSRYRGRPDKFMKHTVADTPKDDVVAILGTFEIATQCDAMVRGISGFGDLIYYQVRDAWRDKGRQNIFSKLVPEKQMSAEDRMKSDKLIKEALEKLKAEKGTSSTS